MPCSARACPTARWRSRPAPSCPDGGGKSAGPVEPGGDIPFARFIAPRVEVELAFVLGRTLKGPGVTLCDVLAATDWVVPAVEIIDARIEQKDRDTQAIP